MQAQTWPLLAKPAQNSSFAWVSRSKSGMTMAASLPPSSSVSRFRVGAALAMIALPVSTDPVKAILPIRSCAVIQRPRSSPPVSTLMTPGGKMPRAISPSRRVASGVEGAGLRISVLPVSSAGPIFQSASSAG